MSTNTSSGIHTPASCASSSGAGILRSIRSPREHIERVQFIKQAQELGFSLEEIKGLLATGGADECRKVRDLLRLKLSELDDRLKAMKGFRRVLARQLSACDEELERHGESACCPVVVGVQVTRSREEKSLKRNSI